jgi:hypothetical protein
MVKHFCDRCGKEITKRIKAIGFQENISESPTYHELCDDCYSAVLTFVTVKEAKICLDVPETGQEKTPEKECTERYKAAVVQEMLKEKYETEELSKAKNERIESEANERIRKLVDQKGEPDDGKEKLKKELGIVSPSNPGIVKEGKHRGRKCTTDHEMVRQYWENSTWSAASVATRMGIPESTVGKDFGILKKAGAIRKERPKDVLKDWCPHCRYRGMTDLHTTCDYILITGHRRPGPNLVSDCIVYDPGEKIRTAEALK